MITPKQIIQEAWKLTDEEILVLEGEVLPPAKPTPTQQSDLEISKMLAAWKPRVFIEGEVVEDE